MNGRREKKKTKHKRGRRGDGRASERAGGRRRDVKSYPAGGGRERGGGQQLCQFMAIMSKECPLLSLSFAFLTSAQAGPHLHTHLGGERKRRGGERPKHCHCQMKRRRRWGEGLLARPGQSGRIFWVDAAAVVLLSFRGRKRKGWMRRRRCQAPWDSQKFNHTLSLVLPTVGLGRSPPGVRELEGNHARNERKREKDLEAGF